MNHIVDMCLLTKVDGGLTKLNEADDDATSWLNNMAPTAFVKWMDMLYTLYTIYSIFIYI